jgi:hypothetical protein
MSARPLAQFLIDFSKPPVAAAAGGSLATFGLSPEDVESLIEEARAAALEEGREAGRIEAQAAAAQALGAYAAEAEDALARARDAWVAEQAETLGARIAAGLEEMEHRICALIAQCLRGVVLDAVAAPAIAALAQTLREHLNDESHVVLRVCGPHDLTEALRSTLAPTIASMDFVESNQPDIVVTLGDTLLETRLAAWRTALNDAVAAERPNG